MNSCKFTLKSGKQCSRNKNKDSDYCWQHVKLHTPTENRIVDSTDNVYMEKVKKLTAIQKITKYCLLFREIFYILELDYVQDLMFIFLFSLLKKAVIRPMINCSISINDIGKTFSFTKLFHIYDNVSIQNMSTSLIKIHELIEYYVSDSDVRANWIYEDINILYFDKIRTIYRYVDNFTFLSDLWELSDNEKLVQLCQFKLQKYGSQSIRKDIKRSIKYNSKKYCNLNLINYKIWFDENYMLSEEEFLDLNINPKFKICYRKYDYQACQHTCSNKKCRNRKVQTTFGKMNNIEFKHLEEFREDFSTSLKQNKSHFTMIDCITKKYKCQI